MLSVVLGPVIKDTTGKSTVTDNYRPIALASIVFGLVYWGLTPQQQQCHIKAVK